MAVPINPTARHRFRSERWIPGLGFLRRMTVNDGLRDLSAGIVLTAILVPAGMGYAVAAGLPAQCGLYATIAPLVAYALFGPSRILVLGPDSSLSALIAAAVLPLSAGNAEQAIALAGMLALMSGAMCMGAGWARLGFITELLSKPIRYGYVHGIALTVIVGQMPNLLGLQIQGTSLGQRILGIGRGIVDGQVNAATALLSAACMTILVAGRRWAPRFPALLLAVIAATCAVAGARLDSWAQVAVVGALPAGMPALRWPSVEWDQWRSLFLSSVAIALVSFADTSVLSRTFARRGGYSVDANREFLALGLANFSAGVFQGFPVSGSASRTPVAEAAGATTPWAGFVGACCIAAMLIAAPQLTEHMPYAVLAAIVVVSCLQLFDLGAWWRLYTMRPSELWLSITCFLGILWMGVLEGVFIAIGLALFTFVWRAWYPYHAVLGRRKGVKGYHDISRHPDAQRVPGLILFRWDAPLFFANANVFEDSILRAVARAPTPTRWIVVAAEPVTDIDITAADMLLEVEERLREQGIELRFAELKGPVKDRLRRYGLMSTFGDDRFFPTLGLAVDRFVKTHHVPWRDWEEDEAEKG